MDPININKSLISLAVSSALGASHGLAGAADITSIVIEDVGSTISDVYSAAPDGRSGGFVLSLFPINPEIYAGVTLFESSAVDGEMLWGGLANPTGSFSTGFIYLSAPFTPFTFGNGAVGEINIDAATGNPEMTISSLDFGINFGGVDFVVPPDPGSLKVNWVEPNSDGSYKFSFQWTHDITTADDPSKNFTAFTAQWILEGTANVSDDALPRIVVDLEIPGGTAQECASSGGSFVQLDTQVSLINGAELAMLSWTVDGQPAGTGDSITPFLGLGAHPIIVTAESTTGQTWFATETVTVSDTTAPDLDVAFVDLRTGESISTIERRNIQRLVARYEATDICDPQPVTEGIGGFAVDNGDELKVQARSGNVMLTTSTLTLRASATDESGNSSSGDATLNITD